MQLLEKIGTILVSLPQDKQTATTHPREQNCWMEVPRLTDLKDQFGKMESRNSETFHILN